MDEVPLYTTVDLKPCTSDCHSQEKLLVNWAECTLELIIINEYTNTLCIRNSNAAMRLISMMFLQS